MATETVDARASHRRSLKATSTATIGGVVAGVLTPMFAAGPTDRIALVAVVGAVLAELAVMRLLGVDVENFSTKDHLYITFMTFSMWFITWTILLTTGTTI